MNLQLIELNGIDFGEVHSEKLETFLLINIGMAILKGMSKLSQGELINVVEHIQN